MEGFAYQRSSLCTGQFELKFLCSLERVNKQVILRKSDGQDVKRGILKLTVPSTTYWVTPPQTPQSNPISPHT